MMEYPTLKQMRDQVARQIGDDSSDRATKIDEWLNSHYMEMTRKDPWPQLLRSSEESVSFTAGAPYVYLPKEVEQLYFVMPENDAAAINLAFENILQRMGSSLQTSGLITEWADAGEFGRRVDFHTAAETLTLTTSGSAAVAAVVHGSITSAPPTVTAQELREEVSISPSTGAVTTNSFREIHSVATAALSSAIVTVTGTTSALIYATIGQGEQTARYRRIRLKNQPASATPVTLIWKRRPFRLISDNQAIEVPIGQPLIDATVATMMVNQREYNSAAIYHQQRALDGAKSVFDASIQQGEKIYLAQPLPRRRGQRIIVVNP